MADTETPAAPRWKGKTHKAKEGTLNGMKKRLRTIERKFARGIDMPATIKNDLQREMGALKASIASVENRRKRGNMIKKYHMVRFFETQKATRRHKQTRKALATTPDDKKLQQDLHIYDVDYHYTRFYPHMEPYISLYAAEKKNGEAEPAMPVVPIGHVPVPGVPGLLRPPMWVVVEKAMVKGMKALERLRDRTSVEDDPLVEEDVDMEEGERKKGRKEKKGKKKKEEEEVVEEKAEESGDDSDGGFFE